MKKLSLLLVSVMLFGLLAGCAAPTATQTPTTAPVATSAPTEAPTAEPTAISAPVTLNIMAAASLTEAFNEIAPVFEAAHPGVTLVFNFAGSQQLAQQLTSAAPADVFASANDKQMGVAVDGGRIDKDTPVPFVQNALVVIVPADNPAGITTLADLAKSGIKLDLAAKEVPVGQYALDFLTKADKDATLGNDYSAKVLANVVSYEENVKAVLTKVSLGEADAGIVYSTDAATLPDKVKQIEISDDLNVIANYPIAVVKDSANAELAQAFVDYILSADGQQVLQKYGFLPVK
ncbi:molybdenum ABC transporter, periplasmic molybdate-binding protein [Longilinea arvoryzae]|uniref:Molybdate-binding protein ModA n=1 Tax=Longilinea arvoryzae TaxID=360412 RepID=A0A0S7BIA3_9CHLR|nr:molybdate ABC transporter substrate-binding protein [Longilinea arvoryzae]GAP14323.1 molybdenum ABC transporter, periplasmic molybdate-binding protein [Longilinea arvoryzae]